ADSDHVAGLGQDAILVQALLEEADGLLRVGAEDLVQVFDDNFAFWHGKAPLLFPPIQGLARGNGQTAERGTGRPAGGGEMNGAGRQHTARAELAAVFLHCSSSLEIPVFNVSRSEERRVGQDLSLGAPAATR